MTSPGNGRKRISSGTSWEQTFGYSRAVRAGQVVEVAGTTAMDGDTLVAPGDVAGQARFIFQKIASALREAGAGLEHVVRTRMFVTDIRNWEAAAAVHGEVFSGIRPAATLVEVSALVSPELLIEIEATAILPDGA
jgi:enamine deaminase RidA (YjgF/YER057c/UK114 family)